MSERRIDAKGEEGVWMAGDRRDGERRRSPRVPIEMWVEESPRERETYFQRSANLSVGGIFLDHTVPHPLGTEVKLQFTLPGESEPVKVVGQIVGATPDDAAAGMSVKFISMSDEARAAIERWLERSAS